MQGVMNHSNHGPHIETTTHNMHEMKMYFNVDLHYILLFSPWMIGTVGKAIAACIGSFILAIIYELLEAFRYHLMLKNACKGRCILTTNGGSTPTPLAGPSCPTIAENDSSNIYINPSDTVHGANIKFMSGFHLRTLRSFFSASHLLQTLLHLIHAFIGYVLMLIVMTYNVYLLLAVLFGFTFGYFLFSRERALMYRSGNCCH